MAEKIDIKGDLCIDQATSLTSHSPEIKSEKSPENTENQKHSAKSTDKGTNSNTVPFYKLFSFADSKDYQLMFVGTIAAVANGTCFAIMTLLLGDIINSFGSNIGTGNVVREASKVCLLFVYLALGSGVASFLQVACWMVTGERQAVRLRSLYLKTILRQDIGFFDKEISTGEVVGRMSGDTVLIQDAIGEKVGKFIQLVTTFIAGFIVAFVKGWLLTLVLLSIVPPLAISGALMTIVIAKMASRGQIANSLATTVVEQTVGSIRTVASFTGEKQAIAKYNKSLTKACQSGVHEGLTLGLGISVITFIISCSYALAVWYGGKMILYNGYTGGDVISVISALLSGSLSLAQTSPCVSAFAAGQAAAFKMFKTIYRKPQIDAYSTEGKKLDDICGVIELRDVYFSYPARPDERIFNGFSLTVPSGKTTALVGQSGSGKSTVISLIERFYDPQAGEILIDGLNLKEFQLQWIREKIGLVSQEPVLFSSTIKDNIAYAKDGATDEDVRAAAELANAANFINKLPKRFDTIVGEHGIQLSGGQKQRVAIARAILKDPRILLLDEATSALDAESERIVQEALDRVMIDRTTLVVAHRLSTIRNADMIAVLHQGKIVEKGPHSELLKNPDGAYCQLIRLQERSKDSEQHDVNNQHRAESVDSGRMSVIQPISRDSSGRGNSSHHLSPASFLATMEINGLESEYNVPASKNPQEVSLFRLAYLNEPEIPVLLLGALGSIASGLRLPAMALLISTAIEAFYKPKNELIKDTRFWALMFLVLAITSLLTIPMRSYFFSVAGCKLIKRVRSMCFEKLVHMEISWFDEAGHSSGSIGARLCADAASLRSLVGDTLALLVENTATAVAGLVLAFEANWQLALIILVLVPLLGLNGYLQVRFRKGFSADAKKMYEEASQVANDAVSNIRTVSSFCAEGKVMHLYQKKCEDPMNTGIREGLLSGAGYGLSFFLLYAVYAVSFYAGARLVQDGKMTFAEVFRVFLALSMASIGLSQTSSLVPDANKAKIGAASIFAILDRKSTIDASDESGTIIEDLKGQIEFQNVSFKYPSRPGTQIFRDLCLSIYSGKTVALVGESGSGKSTVVSLLQRFYNPDSGQILLDGIEIQALQLKWLRQQMGLVSQEPVLFNDTIRANIAYGKEGNASEAEIIAAAELANANTFISSLQKGYNTMVGERGVQLSGGQKQRVAIARAIVKAPKILLLDEATSALDAESERVVQDALDRVMLERTTVVVAHRLSTIKGADLIAVMKNGNIAEKGGHETLIKMKDGIYSSLVALHTSASSN